MAMTHRHDTLLRQLARHLGTDDIDAKDIRRPARAPPSPWPDHGLLRVLAAFDRRQPDRDFVSAVAEFLHFGIAEAQALILFAQLVEIGGLLGADDEDRAALEVDAVIEADEDEQAGWTASAEQDRRAKKPKRLSRMNWILVSSGIKRMGLNMMISA